MVDPTSDEAARMTSMQAVFTWAGFGTEDMTTDKTKAGTLALLLGIKPDTHPRVLALLDEADSMTVVSKWKVANPGATAGDVTYLPPTLAELGMAKLILRACRIVSGCELTVDQMKKQVDDAKAMAVMAKAAATTATSSASERKIKLSSILSQVDDARANLVSTHPTCTPTRLTDRTDPKHSKQDKKTTLTDITNDPNLCGKRRRTWWLRIFATPQSSVITRDHQRRVSRRVNSCQQSSIW